MDREKASSRNASLPLKTVQFSPSSVLCSDFVPGPMDVICTRGRKAYSHPGNQRYRKIIETNLMKYSEATTKSEKSFIVSSIIGSVRESSSHSNFVQLKGGRWYLVEESMVREKIGQSFRDLLHTKYRSSNKAKKQKRRQKESLKKESKKFEYLPADTKSNSDLLPFLCSNNQVLPSINSRYESPINLVSGNANDFEPIPLQEETFTNGFDRSLSGMFDMETVPVELKSSISELLGSIPSSQELLNITDLLNWDEKSHSYAQCTIYGC